jgi:hypothetical protein
MFGVGDEVYDSLNHPGKVLFVQSEIPDGPYKGCLVVSEQGGTSVGLYLRSGLRVVSLVQSLSYKPYEVNIEGLVFVKPDYRNVEVGEEVEVLSHLGWETKTVAAITESGGVITKGKKGGFFDVWRKKVK